MALARQVAMYVAHVTCGLSLTDVGLIFARDRTTVAPQALALLNDRFVRAVARDFADRLLSEEDGGPAEWIDRGFQLALARSPSDTERAAAEEFFELQRSRRAERDPDADAAAVTRRALADFCQVLFGLNEFIYID